MKVFDVAIIGGGVIGSSIAFELAAEKLNVVLLDREEPGRGASWAAAGMLSPGPDSPDALPLVPLAKESLGLYRKFVSAIEEASGLHPHFASVGALQLFPSPQGEAERDKMVAELRALDIAIEPVSLDHARGMENAIGPAARAAAWLPEEATVEPRLLMDALLAALRHREVEIRSGCHVTSLLRHGSRCNGLIAGGEEITANFVVLAAGCYSSNLARENSVENDWLSRCAPTHPVRGQMLALHSDQVNLRRVLRSERGYLVPRLGGRIVAGSTLEEVGFDKRVTAGGMRKILDAAIELAPNLAGAEIVETWAGLRPATPDNLPILGPADIENLFIATGHYRNGILLAPVTAKLARDWILTKSMAAGAAIFSPLRFAERDVQVGSSKRNAANS
ncbi:MAG: glycine oxidase ThiO [Candidatus Acidiferrales bacterium]